MTFVSSLSRLIPSRKRAPFLVTLATTLLLTACGDDHVGRPCVLGVTPPMDPTLVTVNPQALECPSRVCVLPAKLQDPSVDTGPYCTKECGNDEDCTGGEIGSGAGDPRCNTGFVCRTILPKLSNNPLACKPICVCKDFLPTDNVATTPQSCM